MSGTVILAVVLAVIVLVGVVALIKHRGGHGKNNDLRRRFGPEYDHAVARHGDQAKAEAELAARVRAHEDLRLRTLTSDEREGYARQWAGVEERFVDDPRGAAQQAEEVIGGVLTTVGYPAGNPEKQLDLASVDHARALSEFRQARELVRGTSGTTPDTSVNSSTETLRQAMLHYRVMFDDMLGQNTAERAHAGHR